MATGRSLHNWRRKQKLAEKHGSSGKGKGGGKGAKGGMGFVAGRRKDDWKRESWRKNDWQENWNTHEPSSSTGKDKPPKKSTKIKRKTLSAGEALTKSTALKMKNKRAKTAPADDDIENLRAPDAIPKKACKSKVKTKRRKKVATQKVIDDDSSESPGREDRKSILLGEAMKRAAVTTPQEEDASSNDVGGVEERRNMLLGEAMRRAAATKSDNMDDFQDEFSGDEEHRSDLASVAMQEHVANKFHGAEDGGDPKATNDTAVKTKVKRKKNTKALADGVTEAKKTKRTLKKVLKVKKKSKPKQSDAASGDKPASATGMSKRERHKNFIAKKLAEKGILPRGVAQESEAPSENKNGLAEMRKARITARRKARQTVRACICPGSVTDRFARGLHFMCTRSPLDFVERQLLNSGGLSWQNLRTEALSTKVQQDPEADPHDHSKAVAYVLKYKTDAYREKFQRFETILESDALWVPCRERVELAKRLLERGALQKRCERSWNEVLSSLVDPPKETGAAAALFTQARNLCVAAATEWRSLRKEGFAEDSASVKRAWLQMMRNAVRLDQHEGKGPDASGNNHQKQFVGLRRAILARLCPFVDAKRRQDIFDGVATAARSEKAASAPWKGKVVLVQLGIFTFWQAIMMLWAARWLGAEVSIMRRRVVKNSTAGAPEIVFRSSETLGAQ